MMKLKFNGARLSVLKLIACLAVLTPFLPARVMAGTEMAAPDSKNVAFASMCKDKDWTLELGSGVSFSNVRSGQPNQAYTLIPVELTASLKLDDVGLDNYLHGWLRGYSEFFFSADYDQIVRGPETHYEGLFLGPRYNFVQPGWKVIPFVEGGVGFCFADSNPIGGGLGQDFNFSFGAAAGVRYDFCQDWFVRGEVEYRHVSNGGLSEPQFQNHPIDGLGPKISIGYSF